MFADLLDFRWLPSFMTEWWFMFIMVVALIALIGVLLVIRNRRADED
jgi:L-asparagine transporter-like permease